VAAPVAGVAAGQALVTWQLAAAVSCKQLKVVWLAYASRVAVLLADQLQAHRCHQAGMQQ
jgi:hypothetical protein